MDHESALVSRLQAGEARAFRELVENYRQSVYYLALDLTGNQHDAEDISQEVFIKAWRAIGTFRSGAKLSTWLYRITMNAFLDSKRRKQLKVVSLSQPAREDAPDPMAIVADDGASNPARELAAAQIGQHIEDALAILSEKEKSVFVLRHYHDMQINEISGVLDLAEGTIKSLLFRSVRKLRDRLDYFRNETGTEDMR